MHSCLCFKGSNCESDMFCDAYIKMCGRKTQEWHTYSWFLPHDNAPADSAVCPGTVCTSNINILWLFFFLHKLSWHWMKEISWYQLYWRTFAGCTCRGLHGGCWQMLLTAAHLLGSLCQVVGGLFWWGQHGMAGKSSCHLEKIFSTFLSHLEL